LSEYRGIGEWLTAPGALALAGPLLCALEVAALVAGCGPRATITVANGARAPLTDVRIAGEADSTRVRDLAPGDSVRVRAAVHPEDAIVLRGRLAGRPITPMMAVYVEDGYALAMTVDSTGFVRVHDERVPQY